MADATLRSPDKVKILVDAGAVSKDSARIIGSYIDVRRILEHHRGVPPEPTVIFFRKLKFFLGETEIVSLPAEGQPGENLHMRTVEEKRILPMGEKVRLTEAEIHSIALALQLITAEATNQLAGKKERESTPASTG